MKPESWPFVPPTHRKKFGEGPFHVRGTVYSGYLERVHKHLPGGLPALVAEIGIPCVEVFLRDTIFLAASHYDIEPLMHLTRALARIARTPLDKFLRDGSRLAAEQDVVGMYRAQLRSTSVEEMAVRLPRIFSRYFNPCRAEMNGSHPGVTEMRFTGLPASAVGYYVWSSEGFVAGALEAAGARDVHFTWTRPTPDGDLDAIPLQSITARISWSSGSAIH